MISPLFPVRARNRAFLPVLWRDPKINLIGAGGSPELIWADGMSRGEVRRALRVVTDEQAALLVRWEEIHGRTD